MKVAPNYYYPGWWEGGATLHHFINLAKWESLPAGYKSLLLTASQMANNWMQAKYDQGNPPALKRLVAAGRQTASVLAGNSGSKLQGLERTVRRNLREESPLQEIYDAMVAFRADQYCGGG